MLTLIVDGNNLAHRCRHTFSLSVGGIDTSVTYGFMRTLYSTMLRYDPDILVVCWDGGVPEYRRTFCPTYKKRDRSDDDTYEEFLEQIFELQDVLPYFGVASVQLRGAEADDLMYQAALLLSGKRVIMTTDQDLYQATLNLDDVIIYSPTKDIEVTRDNFQEVTDGVEPDWDVWMTYRAMVGDSSDGIPGAHGIGHKYALTLIEHCGGSPAAIMNAAHGKNDPDGYRMSLFLSSKVGIFGLSGFKNAYKVSRLDHDLTGSRKALLEAFGRWQPYEHDEVKAFLFEYLFTSLQEPEFYKAFRKLQDPMKGASYANIRIPIIAPSRELLDASEEGLKDE